MSGHPLETVIYVPLRAIGDWFFGPDTEEESETKPAAMSGNIGETVSQSVRGGFHFVEFHIGSVGGGMVIMLITILVAIGMWYACRKKGFCRPGRRMEQRHQHRSPPPFYSPEATWDARAQWGQAIPMMEMGRNQPSAPMYSIEQEHRGMLQLAPPSSRRLDQLQGQTSAL